MSDHDLSDPSQALEYLYCLSGMGEREHHARHTLQSLVHAAAPAPPAIPCGLANWRTEWTPAKRARVLRVLALVSADGDPAFTDAHRTLYDAAPQGLCAACWGSGVRGDIPCPTCGARGTI